MENIKLKAIVSAIAKCDGSHVNENTKGFFSESEFSSSDIDVEVEDIGTIQLPLTETCIEKLISVSSKAKFGLREQTIEDENVRNTHEIKAEKLHVVIEQTAMKRTLNKIREDLGLSDGSSLSHHLHNMLIYSRGQFFEMHQDTEKMTNMVASFVVVLPSAHIGGDLVIHQGEQKHVFSTQNIREKCVKCIAFYTDCRHEVEKVIDGYRVALTFNLVLHSKESITVQVNEELKNAIQEYFCDDNDAKPQKLIYFLDHEYSEKGLKWILLKGKDHINATSILNAAKSLNLVPHLALVKIQEVWASSDDLPTEWPSEEIHYETHSTLTHWIDISNEIQNYGEMDVFESEICWTKDMKSFKPYEKNCHGYTGNEGCTTDYWYRRAAVVLWSESRQVAMNFSLNYDGSLSDLHKLTSAAGNECLITDTVQKAGQHLKSQSKNTPEYFIKCADIAIYLHDKTLAYDMLSHFTRKIVTVSTAKSLANLQNEYGVDRFLEMLNDKWGCAYGDSDYEIQNVDKFVETFIQSNGDVKIAELLLEKQSIIKDADAVRTMMFYVQTTRVEEIMEKLHQIFKACEVIQNVSILHKFIELVKANPKAYPFLELIHLFWKLKNDTTADFYAHFSTLKTYLVDSVNAELALGKHSNDDWSLEVDSRKINCNCELCVEALRFLRSKTEVKKRWPLKERLRRHLTWRLEGFRLPIAISEERKGSPYKLIIEKKPSMHADANNRYEKVLQYQKALNMHKF